ncbi:MAG: TIGR02449 family protein [Halieaceae bacterium]|nr:TIGR02449 family protein [Halieaceae bacterium]
MPQPRFSDLEQKIDALISLCADLRQENSELRADVFNWRQERRQLAERNERASARVKAIISRLKAMEPDS